MKFNISVLERVSASKKLQADDARNLLGRAKKLYVSKGKKLAHFDLGKESIESLVPHLLGPTGNLRAPTVLAGKTVLVGFNEEAFQVVFG